MVRSKLLRIGGGLVLPLLLFAWSKTGIFFSQQLTDNLYWLNTKDSGLLVAVSPFIDYNDFVFVHADAFFSNANFNRENTIFSANCQIEKVFQLPKIGNNDVLYLNTSVFLPKYYTDYSLIDFSIGDSLSIYLAGRYRMVMNMLIKHRKFLSDSLNDYYQPEIRTSVTLPVPYAYISARGSAGIKKYNNRDIPYFGLSLNLTLPLTYAYACSFILDFYRAGSATDSTPLVSSYADDPFFERENINEESVLRFGFKRLFVKQYLEFNMECDIYNRNFFQVQSITRNDRGARIRVDFTKIISRHITLVAGLESILNDSSADDFSYTKTSIDLNVEWVF